jgi:hypothetical protein
MRKEELKRLKCKAYHESGHAVMAAHLSIEIDEITIVRRVCMGQSDQPTIQLGEVDLSADGRVRIEQASMVAFAGPEAEAVHCSQAIWHPCLRGDRQFPTTTCSSCIASLSSRGNSRQKNQRRRYFPRNPVHLEVLYQQTQPCPLSLPQG